MFCDIRRKMASTVIFLVCAAVIAAFTGEAAAQYFPDTQNVYHLFTRANPTISQPMLLGVPSLLAVNYDPSKNTVVLVHGWNSGPTSPFNLAMIPSILNADDVNVIAVDWSAGASLPDYHGVVSDNVPLSAQSIASFIFWLNLMTGSTLAQYHLIGFEVSAHQVGLIGRNLGGQVPYISAVNPPRTGWDASNMFQPTDGIYTEAIHTDVFGSGMLEPVAQVDIYPNGGMTMPGCYWVDWECSRDRSFMYMAESIFSGGFTSTRCESTTEAIEGNCDSEDTINMGGLTAKTGASGIYHVTTNAESPFSTG